MANILALIGLKEYSAGKVQEIIDGVKKAKEEILQNIDKKQLE